MRLETAAEALIRGLVRNNASREVTLSGTAAAITLGGDLAAQASVVRLEPQHHRNSGEIETLIEQRGDLPQRRMSSKL
jgi:hypothetical protein